jgi:hypothetical protein
MRERVVGHVKLEAAILGYSLRLESPAPLRDPVRRAADGGLVVLWFPAGTRVEDMFTPEDAISQRLRSMKAGYPARLRA